MQGLTKKTTVREATISLLRSFGINKIFGNPGSTELPMFREFPSDFEYVLGLQESVVMGMADGYAQATRSCGFVNLHSAAGTGHALGNLFTAYKNQTPIIVTAGQQARSILPFEPFLFAERATEFPQPYVKWSCEPARAQDVPAAIARAYYVAMQPPRGPVFVSVPVDDWDQEIELSEVPLARSVSTRINGDAALLEETASRLAQSRRPAMVVGAGVALDDAWEEAIALAEKHKARVFVSPMSGRCSFPENHPLFAGFLPAFRDQIQGLLQGHDFILALGAPVWTYHAEGSGPHLDSATELYQITDNPKHASWAPLGTSIIASPKLALGSLLSSAIVPVDREHPSPKVAPPELDGTHFDDNYLLQQIHRLRPENSIIVEEAPSSRGPMQGYLPITRNDGFYTCASGGLGHGLAASVGVAMGRPEEKVIAVMGDGSSLYAIQALWSAAQLKLPISFVIFKNRRYEALIHFGRVFELDRNVGCDLPDVDFCKLAEAQGISAVYVDSAKNLDQALIESFDTPAPTLIEVEIL